MLLNKNSSLFAFIYLLSGLFCSSCVNIPSDAPPPPVLNAEIRFISINPSSVTSPTQLRMAEGPSFTSYTTIALGANTAPTAFTIYNAGSKYLVYNTDTAKSINFETDEKATLVFARNNILSTDSTKAKFTAYKLTLGYRFNPSSYSDTTIVRFVDLMLGGLDTVQIHLNSPSNAATSNVARGKSSAFIKVPKDSTITFFFTGNLSRVSKGDTNVTVSQDSVKITGVSRSVKTVFIYDEYDTAAVSNATVKIKVLDEN